MSEFLRRAAMAERDGDFLMDELKCRFPLPPLPDYDPLDVAYLGTAMLEVAGLPLSAVRRRAGACNNR